MRITRSMLALVVLAVLSACATASVSYSTVSVGSQQVFAESSKFNVLGLTPTPMERLGALRDDLNRQCGDRGVTGIVAKTSTVYAIIGFIEKTEVAGYCAQP